MNTYYATSIKKSMKNDITERFLFNTKNDINIMLKFEEGDPMNITVDNISKSFNFTTEDYHESEVLYDHDKLAIIEFDNTYISTESIPALIECLEKAYAIYNEKKMQITKYESKKRK